VLVSSRWNDPGPGGLPEPPERVATPAAGDYSPGFVVFQRRRTEQTLGPIDRQLLLQQGDAVLVVDVFNDFDHEDGRELLASFRERVGQMRRTIDLAREAAVDLVYVNDEGDRWESDAPALIRHAVRRAGGEPAKLLAPEAGEPFLLKHRYSAFDHTALEILLEARQVNRVVLVGAATEGCIVQTAIDARELGLRASIVADACATTDPELEETALRYAERVGGVHLEYVARP